MRAVWLACCVVGLSPIAHAQELSFYNAIARAGDGPSVEARLAGIRAAEQSLGAAGQLPDPELVLGLENVPAEGPDAYRLDRDFMTMQTVGIMQVMPSGAERRARRAMAQADVSRADASLAFARFEARMGAARAWIGFYYAERRVAALRTIQTEARASAAAARGRLGAGASGVDDAIGAEIEATRIADRLADAEAAKIAARAELVRWIGADPGSPTGASPEFRIDGVELRAMLRTHPYLASYVAEEQGADAGLAMARAERAPDWSWQLMYQRRDRDFGDMASVEVRIGLPLFQAWRQAPIVEARRADQTRAVSERAAAQREQEAALEAGLAQYVALEGGVARARATRLPLARQRAEAARGAFAAGTMNAADLIGLRRESIEAELDLIDLEERLAVLGAALTLPFAETAP